MTILVIEKIIGIEGKFHELKLELQKLVVVSKQEIGCLRYELAEPFTDGSNEFLVTMIWKTREALRSHEQSAHIVDFEKNFSGVLYKGFEETLWTLV